jgi:N-acetylmuramoyl-L-alanine amidase
VAVVGGHGLYYNYEYNDWRAQRDPSNGMTEDFVTPYYARDLSAKLVSEGWASVAKARTNDSTLHVPSGQQWWRVGARYWLKNTLPAETGIWNSLPNATHVLRERDEDIRSRPLFANHVGAAAAINIHTNAAGPTVRGTRVIYHPGRVQDQQLAANMLCYMKESIRSTTSYADWEVSPMPSGEEGYGENTWAQMPSVIVEVGFHTNAQDALALQNSTFRTAAVNGMAKAWHLHSQGIGCLPLKVTNIPPIQVTQNVPINWTVHYEGYPKFPLTVTTKFKTCPAGWNCAQQSNRITTETSSPLTMQWRCSVTGTVAATTFQVESVITDSDGVKSAPVAHTVTCSPPAAGAKAAATDSHGVVPAVVVTHQGE